MIENTPSQLLSLCATPSFGHTVLVTQHRYECVWAYTVRVDYQMPILNVAFNGLLMCLEPLSCWTFASISAVSEWWGVHHVRLLIVF